MSHEQRPSPPFVAIGAVVSGNARATMQTAISVLRALRAQPVSPQGGPESVTLASPDAGPLILRLVFDEPAQSYVGVELWASGDLLGGPSWIELEADDAAESERIRQFVKAAFLATCDRLHPLYGGVGVEWSVPAPEKLSAQSVWLPCDFFWSRELDGLDPALAPDLAAIYGTPGHAFSHGSLIAVGGLLDPHSQSPDQPITAGRAAAKRLAQTLSRLEK
jgi:hypothetical protein